MRRIEERDSHKASVERAPVHASPECRVVCSRVSKACEVVPGAGGQQGQGELKKKRKKSLDGSQTAN